MEFIDLSRYKKIENGIIATFSDLIKMRPVLFTDDLEIIDTSDNQAYIEDVVSQNHLVIPVKRIFKDSPYENRRDFPQRVLLEMTSNCNTLCRMCPHHDFKRPRMDMPTELYKRMVEEVNQYGVDHLALYHIGESLVHPGFKDIVNYISTKNKLGSIWMSTNGQLLSEDLAKWVLTTSIGYINYSLHAVTSATYKSINPNADFGTVQKNFDTLCGLKKRTFIPKKPFIHCQMIEQKTTRHEVDPFIKRNYNSADIVSINMLEYVDLQNNQFGYAQRERKELTSCPRLSRNDCFVFSNGDVTLCARAINAEINLGNINDKTLYEIWNGSERQRVLELNKKKRMNQIEFCAKCTDYDL